MVEMILCCTTKEATTAVSIVKSIFQTFNVYAFGDAVTKIYYIIAAIINIFIWDLIPDNKTVAWIHYVPFHEHAYCPYVFQRDHSIVVSVLLISLFFFAFEELWYTF